MPVFPNSQHETCIYCGNNPVPHFFHWYFESVNILFAPVREVVLFNPVASATKRAMRRMRFGQRALRTMLACRAVSMNDKRELCTSPRAKVLWEEAERRGIDMREVQMFRRNVDTFVAEKNGRQVIFSGLPRPEGHHNSILDVMDDKKYFKHAMREAGIPVPDGGSAWNFIQARNIFRRVQKPVIVKPRTGSRGRHSTTYIYTEEQLKKAFDVAKQLCFWVIVEEHIEGPVYRGTVINYECEGVLRGDAPSVVGDGVSSIMELAKARNAALPENVKPTPLDSRTEIFLHRQALGLASVPEAGRRVYLSEKVGIGYGGSSSEDFDICHPENKELCERAARALREPIVGFDFIIPDITKPYTQQRVGFIEANSIPFINLHHHPLLGQPRNVAAAVWELVGF